MLQKLFTAKQIQEIDKQTIIKQQITSDALMERAATALYHALRNDIKDKKRLIIFCGKGNNGGDALVLARLLQPDYDVKCVIVPFSPKASPDFELNYKRLQALPVDISEFDPKNLPVTNKEDVLVDGIFGTGLSRPVEGISKQAIDFINHSRAKVLSIDMPSGLNADKSNNPDDTIVKADKVYSFQFPKISFFFPENAGFVPDFEVVDIGLEQSVIDTLSTNYYLITGEIKEIIKQRHKFSYKNQFGHALIVGGSYGMFGAPVLASKAALRIGAGLVSNFLPREAYNISQIYVPEVMTHTDTHKQYLSKIKTPKNINAIGLGMGMSTKPIAKKALHRFLKTNNKALLLDADALNILAEQPDWLNLLPENTILTPHPGEFNRLVGGWQNDTEKLEKLKNLSQKYKLIVILKGAYTIISDGDNFYVSPFANPALATAGSGDVLSGIITGLLAQSYQALGAAMLGVYLHAQAAEIYTQNYSDFSMIASDIIDNLKRL